MTSLYTSRSPARRRDLRGWKLFLIACFWLVSHGVSPAEEKLARYPVLERTYLPPDASFALFVRPAELAKAAYAAPVVAAADAVLADAKLGTSVANIEEFRFVILGVAKEGPLDGYILIRGTQPIDWKAVFDPGGNGKVEKLGEQTLYIRGRDAFWLPDDRTVVVGMNDGAQRTLEPVDPKDRAGWSDDWEKAAAGPLAGLLHMRIVQGQKGPGPDGQPSLALEPLTDNTRYAVLRGSLTDKGLALAATVAANSNAGAVKAAPVISKVLANFATLFVAQARLPEVERMQLGGQLNALLAGTQIVTEGKSIDIRATVTPEMIKVFAETFKIAVAR